MDNLYTELKGSIDGRPQVVIGRNESNLMRVRVYVEEDVGGEHRIDQLLFAPANDELGSVNSSQRGAVFDRNVYAMWCPGSHRML